MMWLIGVVRWLFGQVHVAGSGVGWPLGWVDLSLGLIDRGLVWFMRLIFAWLRWLVGWVRGLGRFCCPQRLFVYRPGWFGGFAWLGTPPACHTPVPITRGPTRSL